MFFQREGLHIFIGQIFRRVHDHTCITYRDAQEILPLFYDFLFGQKIQKNTSLIKVREAILSCTFLLYQSSMTPIWRISSQILCAPHGDHTGLNWCPPAESRVTRTLPNSTLQFYPPLLWLTPLVVKPLPEFQIQTGTHVRPWWLLTGKLQNCSFTENLRAGFNTASALILSANVHWEEPKGPISIYEKNLEGIQDTQWVAFLSVWEVLRSWDVPSAWTSHNCLWCWCHEHH